MHSTASEKNKIRPSRFHFYRGCICGHRIKFVRKSHKILLKHLCQDTHEKRVTSKINQLNGATGQLITARFSLSLSLVQNFLNNTRIVAYFAHWFQSDEIFIRFDGIHG